MKHSYFQPYPLVTISSLEESCKTHDIVDNKKQKE